MGVPQRRERVFFIALRKDLSNQFMERKDMFTMLPKLEMEFKEQEIPFSEIEDSEDTTIKDNTEISKYWNLVKEGQSFSTAHPKGSFFNDYKCRKDTALNTITADPNHGAWHYSIKRLINFNEAILGGSYATDYDFKGVNPKYLIGMSVPPVMTAQVASNVYDQWLSKL